MLMENYGLPLAQYMGNVSFKHIHPSCPLSAKYEPKHSGVQGQRKCCWGLFNANFDGIHSHQTKQFHPGMQRVKTQLLRK
jgi:hypothetical protein